MVTDVSENAIHVVIHDAEKRDGILVGAVVATPSAALYSHNEDRRFVAASTVKIPVMIELFRQIERSKRSLSDRYVLQDQDRTPGSGVMLHLHSGMEFTLQDLIFLMISISDNTATNVLIDLIGMELINATMQELGMTRSTLGRKMKGRAAQGDEVENWATPSDYAKAVTAILTNRAASPSSCAQMIAMLEKQQNDRRIARYIAKGSTRWGSKTGSVPGVANDVGFVVTEQGTLVISIFCEGLTDNHVGERIIGDISRAAMETI
jgi:beta-lactamase class A